MINWSDPSCKISRYFTVKDAIFLPRWNRLATESDGLTEDAKAGLVDLFQKMDLVREFLGVAIWVHVSFRPIEYNELIGGANDSAHVARSIEVDEKKVFIAAVDWSAHIFDHIGESDCDKIRELLRPRLVQFGLRMEENPPGSTWVHTDTRPVLPGHLPNFLP
jgi:hypothetical protein